MGLSLTGVHICELCVWIGGREGTWTAKRINDNQTKAFQRTWKQTGISMLSHRVGVYKSLLFLLWPVPTKWFLINMGPIHTLNWEWHWGPVNISLTPWCVLEMISSFIYEDLASRIAFKETFIYFVTFRLKWNVHQIFCDLQVEVNYLQSKEIKIIKWGPVQFLSGSDVINMKALFGFPFYIRCFV